MLSETDEPRSGRESGAGSGVIPPAEVVVGASSAAAVPARGSRSVLPQEGAGERDAQRRLLAGRRSGRFGGATAGGRAAEFVDDGVQPQAGDELHDVVRGAVVLPEPVDRDDVRVVQLGGRLRLPLEPPPLGRVAEDRGRQQLDRDPPAERHLLGLVHDAHPAAPDLAEQAEVAQLGDRRGVRDLHGQLGAGVRLGPLQLDQGGEQRPDVVGQVRVPVAVLLERAAAPRPAGGRRTRRPVGSAARRGRRSTRSWRSPSEAAYRAVSTSLSRFRART